VIEDLAKRAALGAEVTEADVRAALGQARGGKGAPGLAAAGVSLPGGKRGPIVPKTKAQAAYVDMLGRCELSFGVGPAGTGKTFLAAAYGASLLRRGQVDRLVITRPAVEAGEIGAEKRLRPALHRAQDELQRSLVSLQAKNFMQAAQ
jgi:phosphate starvation-inducible PhoH-like protein